MSKATCIDRKRPIKETYRSLLFLARYSRQKRHIYEKRPATETNWPCLISGTTHTFKAPSIDEKRPTKETYWFPLISGMILTSKEMYMYEKRPIQQTTDALSLHIWDTIYMSKETCKYQHNLYKRDLQLSVKETHKKHQLTLSLQTSHPMSKETRIFLKNPEK